MARRVGVKKISEIVDSSKVVSDFNASDVNQSIGTLVTSLTGRDGKDSVTSLAFGTLTLQADSQGFKCLRSSDPTVIATTSTAIVPNNNETFFSVINIKGTFNGAYAFNDGVSITVGGGTFTYANNTVGSGRVNYTSVYNRKIVLTFVMTATSMTVYEGFNLIATLANPALLTTAARTTRVFRISSNTTNIEVDFYSSVRVQEALSGEKLKQAIRGIAFENGVEI